MAKLTFTRDATGHTVWRDAHIPIGRVEHRGVSKYLAITRDHEQLGNRRSLSEAAELLNRHYEETKPV